MNKHLGIALLVIIVFSSITAFVVYSDPHSISYGDFMLEESILEQVNEVWDLTSCPLIINFTYNGEGFFDDQSHRPHLQRGT